MFHVTVYYRTATTCSTWRASLAAADHDAAMAAARLLFAKRRPRAVRVDRVEVIGSVGLTA